MLYPNYVGDATLWDKVANCTHCGLPAIIEFVRRYCGTCERIICASCCGKRCPSQEPPP